jgi:hypothetical protein
MELIHSLLMGLGGPMILLFGIGIIMWWRD